jgi:hypothetical protein
MAGAIARSGHRYDATFRPVEVLMFAQVLAGFTLLPAAQRRGGIRSVRGTAAQR